jgi:hypothetical protein
LFYLKSCIRRAPSGSGLLLATNGYRGIGRAYCVA